MTSARLQYQRNSLKKRAYFIAALGAILVATFLISPVDTLMGEAALGTVVVIVGGVAIVSVRRTPIVACASCKMELASVIKSAMRSRSSYAVCPRCGSNVEV